ncbi:MAG: DUF222 domain-containing protein [Acidimicrobiia bacterium]
MFDTLERTRHTVEDMSIGDHLDAMCPGIFLAAALSSVDVHSLSGHDRVAVLRAHQRMVSYYSAKMYEDMNAIADAVADDEGWDRESALEGAAAEIRVALNLTRRAADIEFSFALDLKSRLPAVAELLARGLIDVRRAKAIDHATAHLSTAAAQVVVDRIAAALPDLTTGQIMARIRKLSLEADPESAMDRYESACTNRRVVTEPSIDGTSHLYAFDLPPDRVAAATRRLNALARTLKVKSEGRTMDQLRADVFIDLLLGAEPTSVEGSSASGTKRGMVDIRVDLDTLVGLNSHPGDLGGYGPIVGEIAARIVEEHHDARWSATVVDTETGNVLSTRALRRRPTAGTARAVRAQAPICVFPGCRMPSTQCDIDHTVRWVDRGPTADRNLEPLCRHDHVIKDTHRWTYRRCQDGSYRWVTALGQIVTRPPDPP